MTYLYNGNELDSPHLNRNNWINLTYDYENNINYKTTTLVIVSFSQTLIKLLLILRDNPKTMV